jgi:hypothetical protein
MIFVSRSLNYAADPVYANPMAFDGHQQAKVVLEFKLQPGSYDTGPSTLEKKVEDSYVKHEEMEYYTNRHGTLLLTGFLVKMDLNDVELTARLETWSAPFISGSKSFFPGTYVTADGDGQGKVVGVSTAGQIMVQVDGAGTVQLYGTEALVCSLMILRSYSCIMFHSLRFTKSIPCNYHTPI